MSTLIEHIERVTPLPRDRGTVHTSDTGGDSMGGNGGNSGGNARGGETGGN